ncbi:unnamed protein product [Phytomonas sp. EM1]|nr:unnamed protein product [Phytomonas sp. EM1]|eukprot:CCW60177.1 unnamed protein product [Phytomonas sp. isolate EM1]
MKSTFRKKSKKREGIKIHDVLSTAEAPPNTFPVIDHESKKLFIPLEAMFRTRAMKRDGVPSLCRIFMSGRCLQGDKCYQAHADSNTISKLRAIALAEPSCCEKHGAPPDNSGICANFSFSVKYEKPNESFYVGPLEYCITRGLRELLGSRTSTPATTELTVPIALLCKLHSSEDGTRCCRFGNECKFVHVCREVLRAMKKCVLNPTAEPVVPPLKHEISSKHHFLQILTPIKESPSDRKNKALELSLDPSSVSGDSNSLPSSQPDSLALVTPSSSSIRYTLPLLTTPAMVISFSQISLGVVWRHNPYPTTPTSSAIET